MRIIWLTKGQFTLVDDEDYQRLIKYKWHAHKKKYTFYAVSTTKSALIPMHRLILGINDPKLFSDHVDRNGLNNQKYNLRVVNQSENECNKVSHKDSMYSKFKGVTFNKRTNKWVARICKNKNVFCLGVFDSEQDAALVYNGAALKVHGKFANLNKV